MGRGGAEESFSDQFVEFVVRGRSQGSTGRVSKAGAVSLSLQFLPSVQNKLCRSEKAPSELFCSAFFFPTCLTRHQCEFVEPCGNGQLCHGSPWGGSWCVCLVCACLWVLKRSSHRSPLLQGTDFGSPSSARGKGQVLALPILAPDPNFPLQPFPVPTAEKGKPGPPRLPVTPCTPSRGTVPVPREPKGCRALLPFPRQSWTSSSLRSHPRSDFCQEGPFSTCPFPAFPPPVRFSWRESTFPCFPVLLQLTLQLWGK